MKTYSPSGKDYVHICEIPRSEIDKIDFATFNQPKETLTSFYNRQTKKPDVLINGGFFGISGGLPCFGLIDDSKVEADDGARVWGIGVTGNTDIAYGKIDAKKWRDWISGYPVLVVNGQRATITDALEVNYRARRSMLGFNANNIYVIAVDAPGMLFYEMQNLMLELKCEFGINLDGGGSTRLMVEGETITNGSENRAVDNGIAIYLKTVKKVIYRVQLGAFLSKTGAEKYRETIQSLGGVYANAFVKKVGLVHKVQVGAFSYRNYAENMVNDLKSKGFKSFIVSE